MTLVMFRGKARTEWKSQSAYQCAWVTPLPQLERRKYAERKSNWGRKGAQQLKKSIIQEGDNNKRRHLARPLCSWPSRGKVTRKGRHPPRKTTADNHLCTWFMKELRKLKWESSASTSSHQPFSLIAAVLSALSFPGSWVTVFCIRPTGFACGPHYCHLAELHYRK